MYVSCALVSVITYSMQRVYYLLYSMQLVGNIIYSVQSIIYFIKVKAQLQINIISDWNLQCKHLSASK